LSLAKLGERVCKSGQTNVPASIQIKWLNTTPNDTHANNVTGIELTPSCGAFVASSICPALSADPGILTSAPRNGAMWCCYHVHDYRGRCADRQSRIHSGFVLPVNGTCIISFTVNVNSNPTKDADRP
jgi:hypothetical protein